MDLGDKWVREARSFLEYKFSPEIERISISNDVDFVRYKYKELKRNINLAQIEYCSTEYFQELKIIYPRLLSFCEYSQSLFSKTFQRLSLLEEFSPYKQIIHDMIDKKYKLLNIGLWPLYYNKYPSIHEDIERDINIKIRKGIPVDVYDYFFILKNKGLTSFGFDHLYEIIEILPKIIKDHNMNTIFEEYFTKYNKSDSLYSRRFENENSQDFIGVRFSSIKSLHTKLKKLNRETENIVRISLNIPKIGEGWISETKLLNELKSHYKKIKIIQHARLHILGKQHLDIFFPYFRIAIEYQGEQHFRPVEFFGGEEAYKKNVERDKRKKDICESNNIHLIYVTKGYNIKTIISEIEDRRSKPNKRIGSSISYQNSFIPS